MIYFSEASFSYFLLKKKKKKGLWYYFFHKYIDLIIRPSLNNLSRYSVFFFNQDLIVLHINLTMALIQISNFAVAWHFLLSAHRSYHKA